LYHGTENAPTHYLGTEKTLYVINSNKNNIVFKAGNNFGVDTNGKLYASDAEISGKITSKEGSIGGWTINSTGLRYGGTDDIPDIYVGSPKAINGITTQIDWNKNGTIDNYDTNWSNVVLKAGDAFFVQSNGALWANNAHINGTINATSGTFDNVTINSNSTFSGSLSAATGTFSGSLSAATGSFSGSVDASSFSMDGSPFYSTAIKYIYRADDGAYSLMQANTSGLYTKVKVCTGISVTYDTMTGYAINVVPTYEYVDITGYSSYGFAGGSAHVLGYFDT